jgi:hypothetical protein
MKGRDLSRRIPPFRKRCPPPANGGMNPALPVFLRMQRHIRGMGVPPIVGGAELKEISRYQSFRYFQTTYTGGTPVPRGKIPSRALRHRRFPHRHIASTTGRSVWPNRVSEYSTFGGTCG